MNAKEETQEKKGETSKTTIEEANENEYRKSIEEMWTSIDKEIEENHETYYKPKNVNTTPNCIRVFVSSTFTDFFNEREVLVKEVFPELREWCIERDCDLIGLEQIFI